MKNLASLPTPEKPREKLRSLGPSSLSDQELLALLLGNGRKGRGVHLLAAEVLSAIDRKNGDLSWEDLLTIKGIGSAKAALLLGALEFARRRISPQGMKIREARDIVPLLLPWARKPQEHFLTVTLNGANEVLETRVITVGLANTSQVHPREVFCDAITDRACSIIVAHNHPSGDLTPSNADREVTTRLSRSAETLGIRLLDHLIISERGYYSFQEHGFL
ncbi:MAG: DNA repair protein RadC [Bdellovibrionales bacterium]|nr:DNA repair protein RadC [Bdellovibrionales bacterium]